MEFNKEKYKVYTWKYWSLLHWVLNPVLVINELILGQRVPKVSVKDKTLDKSIYESFFVPCPHCKTLHDGRTWSPQNGTGFKNWYGLYCPNCGNIIPCLTNWMSFLILLITFPIWGWFRKSLKAKWLEKQPKRYENLDIVSVLKPYEGKNLIKSVMIFLVVVFLLNSIILPYFTGQEITTKTLLFGILGSTIGALVYVFIMKLIMKKKK